MQLHYHNISNCCGPDATTTAAAKVKLNPSLQLSQSASGHIAAASVTKEYMPSCRSLDICSITTTLVNAATLTLLPPLQPLHVATVIATMVTLLLHASTISNSIREPIAITSMAMITVVFGYKCDVCQYNCIKLAITS